MGVNGHEDYGFVFSRLGLLSDASSQTHQIDTNNELGMRIPEGSCQLSYSTSFPMGP